MRTRYCVIECDGIDENGLPCGMDIVETTFTKADSEARKQGWRIYGKRDYCKECRPNGIVSDKQWNQGS